MNKDDKLIYEAYSTDDQLLEEGAREWIMGILAALGILAGAVKTSQHLVGNIDTGKGKGGRGGEPPVIIPGLPGLPPTGPGIGGSGEEDVDVSDAWANTLKPRYNWEFLKLKGFDPKSHALDAALHKHSELLAITAAKGNRVYEPHMVEFITKTLEEKGRDWDGWDYQLEKIELNVIDKTIKWDKDGNIIQ